ncbi:SDR family oxidoreductase [Microbacterium sp. APC 3898]|uniref:SDR family oxidoreductase n=1 Tax=Planococcus notacanthi TaxID=3035188 RepID=A0ABT7ZLI1_9BACL|nr:MULTISPECIES: SDR family NAD(P)-dependent oxidoreductase [Terrabacteria group]MDN3428026.1 SDR family oxidoreductase [Planococcus sp. APC 4016]MDN3498439.1 SDR family oxidoreductase [Microbacterium sp. APC 3898]
MADSLFDLTGRTALITGGGSGLGRNIAEIFAEYGANIAVCSRKIANCQETVDQLESRYGIKALAYECNVGSEEQVKAVVQSVLSDFDSIDILVNNSGATWGEETEKMPLDAWEKVMNVNVTGTFLMSKEVGRHMIRSGYGKIINIGSVAGLRAEPPEVLNAIGYSTSKAAVHHFTKDLARKWAGHGLYVNAIAPGFFETKMTKHVIAQYADTIVHKNPMKKLGDTRSLQGAALFLAGAASDYITGQVIAVDGGSSL